MNNLLNFFKPKGWEKTAVDAGKFSVEVKGQTLVYLLDVMARDRHGRLPDDFLFSVRRGILKDDSLIAFMEYDHFLGQDSDPLRAKTTGEFRQLTVAFPSEDNTKWRNVVNCSFCFKSETR